MENAYDNQRAVKCGVKKLSFNESGDCKAGRRFAGDDHAIRNHEETAKFRHVCKAMQRIRLISGIHFRDQ